MICWEMTPVSLGNVQEELLLDGRWNRACRPGKNGREEVKVRFFIQHISTIIDEYQCV